MACCLKEACRIKSSDEARSATDVCEASERGSRVVLCGEAVRSDVPASEVLGMALSPASARPVKEKKLFGRAVS